MIWDQRRRKAFCARDRLGNKPFVYHWNGRTLAFSSDTEKDEEYVEPYRELFTRAVQRMSRSDSRLACEVSGGLDSSALACSHA